MDVMENMLHTESSRMYLSINGSCSEERLGKLPIEDCDFSSRVGPPKYKWRVVSAVRDFPPGCGRLAPQINLRPKEEVACVGNVKNPLTGDESVDESGVDYIRTSENGVVSGLMESSENLAPREILGLKNGLKSKEKLVAASDLVDQLELMIDVTEGVIEPLKAVGWETSGFSNDQVNIVASKQETSLKSWSPHDCPVAVSIGSGLVKSPMKRYPPRRIVSATRDFPPFCGRNAPRLEKEECLKALASLKDSNLGQENSVLGKPLEETVRTDVKQMEEGIQCRNGHKIELEKNISQLPGKEVQAKSARHAAKDMNHKDEFGTSYEMNKICEDTREKKSKPPHESDQYKRKLSDFSVIKKENANNGGLEENLGTKITVYTKDSKDLGLASERMVVLGLMAAPNCPWRQGKWSNKRKLDDGMSESERKRPNFIQLEKSKSALKMKDKARDSGGNFMKESPIKGKADYQGMGQLVIWNKENSVEHDEECEDFYVAPRSQSFDVSIPPFGHSISSGKGDDCDAFVTRNKVRETLRLFQAVCRKLLQEEEANLKERGNNPKRIDFQASKILKDKGKYIYTGKQFLGSVPGVEVGDEFHYRMELHIIGLHRPTQGGIDCMKHGGNLLATSIVSSGVYADDLDNSDYLIYTGAGGGAGGNVLNGGKDPEDQKLERGNLALKNSINAGNAVRVIRGFKETKVSDSSNARAKVVTTYTYDGLYRVEKYWQELGPHDKLVFKFQLNRIPGQPELPLKVVKLSKKSKVRVGICVDDISEGKELIPICAVNTVDDEKPPPFEYITGMIYPDCCRPIPPKGCDCTHGCSDSDKCFCAVKNGGEIPYNYNGAIVEAKPLVYECGPLCKCPPSCRNRVSQHGIKFQLEIFKTELRGWGVRSLSSIPSGSFICEYIGELLEEMEADQRTGNDEYLFDIGNNYSDHNLWGELSNLIPDAQFSSCEVVNGGFTIDAARYGNIGRFVNHSCSPNLYAQNVLYDREDKRIPHIMLFAAENIPPLQELTYHYNYKIDQVLDSNGNIKKKKCYCGSPECTGRLY